MVEEKVVVDTPSKIKKMGAPGFLAIYLVWIHNPHMRTHPAGPELHCSSQPRAGQVM